MKPWKTWKWVNTDHPDTNGIESPWWKGGGKDTICNHTSFKACHEAFYSRVRASGPIESQAYLLRRIRLDLFSALTGQLHLGRSLDRCPIVLDAVPEPQSHDSRRWIQTTGLQANTAWDGLLGFYFVLSRFIPSCCYLCLLERHILCHFPCSILVLVLLVERINGTLFSSLVIFVTKVSESTQWKWRSISTAVWLMARSDS